MRAVFAKKPTDFAVKSVLVGCLAGCGGGASIPAPAPELASPAAMIARAKALELPTTYVPVPGDPMEHYASGYAKIMCSNVFISGLGPDLVSDALGYFVAPPDKRLLLGKPNVDYSNQRVSVTVPNGPTVVAQYLGSQGCVTLAPGSDSVFYTPEHVTPNLPDAATTPWPMGDLLPGPSTPLPAGVDQGKLNDAVTAAFAAPAGYTSAFVVTYKGRLIAERYMDGITSSTPLESWSMGKSVVGTLMGVLLQQGAYSLDEPAPIPEWQTPGDGRQQIRISDILHMSSGLRIIAPDDPDYDPNGPYPDHLYFYTGHVNMFNYAATRPQQWPPNTVGRYRNTDPVLGSYLVRLAVEKRGDSYLTFPQRNLFDKIGIRTMVMETDPYGNFLTQGYEFMSARDWARLGNLYLQDGVWNGERILPAGYSQFVSTLAPAWAADNNPVYGAFFWLNGAKSLGSSIPISAYYMLGANGQYVIIVPTYDLVIVRLGFPKGDPAYVPGMLNALSLLMQAIPPN